MKNIFDLAIIYEHPEWHQPLFEALERKNILFAKIDLKQGAFTQTSVPRANLYYNLVSPSAYVRGNQRAISYALSLCNMLETQEHRVLNGTKSMHLEFSKSAQIAFLRKLGIDHPRTIVFNNIEALKNMNGELRFPMILKPEQGGSGARMYLVNELNELELLLNQQPELWQPDNLFLLQEKLEYDHSHGIVRLEFVGGKFLYAIRVVTNGTFNLCPSIVCNPEGGNGQCEIPVEQSAKPQFHPYTAVPAKAIEMGRRIMKECGHATCSVEYLLTSDGRMVFYDINSNSNLRESIAREFGIQPFDVVASYLKKEAGNEGNIFLTVKNFGTSRITTRLRELLSYRRRNIFQIPEAKNA